MINELLEELKKEDNPLNIAIEISSFVAELFRNGQMTLYEAYSVYWEAIKYERKGYLQLTHRNYVRISTCITILNQKLLADIFDDRAASNMLKQWAVEAYKLNNEKRPHYIIDRFMEFLSANERPELLEELLQVRKNYEKLSFNDGPYHCEEFPYDCYSFEEILLDNELLKSFRNNKTLSEEIENLIVEINLL